jgi:hypothetical protein
MTHNDLLSDISDLVSQQLSGTIVVDDNRSLCETFETLSKKVGPNNSRVNLKNTCGQQTYEQLT